MRHPYKIDLHEKHLLLKIDGKRLLLDTGSPKTFIDSGKLKLCRELFRGIDDRFDHLTAEKLSGFLGVEVDGLLGADLIARFALEIDLAEQQVAFWSAGTNSFKGKSIGMKKIVGIPVVGGEVAGQPLPVIIDTGAPLAYIGKRFTEGLEPEGLFHDFHPHHGPFSTPVFSLPTCIGDYEFDISFGRLPDALSAKLALQEETAVIGWGLLSRINLLLDYPGNRMVLKARK